MEFRKMVNTDEHVLVTGLNDNIEFMGRQLHVQTEKIGLPKPGIVTQVFNKGRIVFSKKTEFSTDLNDIQSQMHKQHFEVIQTIAKKQARLQGAS
jgi:hypothetical protein